MKSVLMSVNPEWIEKIHRGEKIWEVRTTIPKWTLNIKCNSMKVYNYETKANSGRGKVVSEWEVRIAYKFVDLHNPANRELICKNSCLTEKQLWDYSNGGKKTIYCWQINDLKIYDQPKELSEFGLRKAPQSWCYVEAK